jgi:putative methyltransferase (TIGR04325 family)
MTFRALLKDILPPAIIRRVRVKDPSPSPLCDFTGDYADWAAAEAKCTGYNARDILEITRSATLRVKRGEAAFERDSVIFDRMEFSFPLLAGLARAAACNGGRLSVLDFGGALGSSYFQSKPFLAGLRQLRWGVVEQPAHVACGNAEIACGELKFFATPEDCRNEQEPNVLLLSSVLQYLRDPYTALGHLGSLRIPNVIIDRTAFLPGDRERLTVQKVPERIYRATYPAWFLNERRMVGKLAELGYRVLADFPGADKVSLEGSESYFKGFICVRA